MADEHKLWVYLLRAEGLDTRNLITCASCVEATGPCLSCSYRHFFFRILALAANDYLNWGLSPFIRYDSWISACQYFFQRQNPDVSSFDVHYSAIGLSKHLHPERFVEELKRHRKRGLLANIHSVDAFLNKHIHKESRRLAPAGSQSTLFQLLPEERKLWLDCILTGDDPALVKQFMKHRIHTRHRSKKGLYVATPPAGLRLGSAGHGVRPSIPVLAQAERQPCLPDGAVPRLGQL